MDGCGWLNLIINSLLPTLLLHHFLQIPRRIHRIAVLPHLKVQVWPSGEAGGADSGDRLTLLYRLPFTNKQTAGVGIEGAEPTTVVNDHCLAVAAVPA